MTTTEFQAEFMQSATLPKAGDGLAVIDEYVSLRERTIIQARDLGVGKEGLSDIEDKMASSFVRRWMMLRFAALDLSFTKRKWWVEIVRDGDEVRIAGTYDSKPDGNVDPVTTLIAGVPRFFSVEIDAKPFALGEKDMDKVHVNGHAAGDLIAGQRASKRYRLMNITVDASLPDGITSRHAELARGAISHFRAASAILFSRGIDISARLRENRYGDTDLKVKIIWAPNADALTVRATPPRPAGDPAVLFCLAGHSFLLDFYDTPNEQPIEHLIREFSEGRFRASL